MLQLVPPATLVAQAKRTWRRSLQVRVVTITLALSSVLVLTFGLIVGNRIISGLVEVKTEDAMSQVEAGSNDAARKLRVVSSRIDPILADTVKTAVPALAEAVKGYRADVAIVPGDPDLLQPQSAPTPRVYEAIPAGLRDAVASEGFVGQRLNLDIGHGKQLYLVFGRQLKPAWGGTLEIYYFFPLANEVEQAGLVTNTIALTGFALVVLLAAVAALVTGMVVRPVRVAARTAQRLSNGLLDQRMDVKGEDDLARLAASFNQMAENLQRHILRLEDMSRLQRRFTSDVSHELRTPLTTVRMAADLIFSERDRFEAPVARSAELLQTELDRFESLLSELLEISRFDAGFAALDAEPADVGPLVQRVVDRLSPLAERAGVRVAVDLPHEPVVAEIDVRRVERILRNLLGNAIEHGEGKPVKVRLRVREDAVAITVRDYGVGLKPGEEKQVFNRFWRADPSRARQTGGTGLGLSISLEDAKLHGGWLDAWGEPGRGAQFRLTLPCRAGASLTTSPLQLRPTDALTGPRAAPDVADGLPGAVPARAGVAQPPPATAPDGASEPARPASSGGDQAGAADAAPAASAVGSAPAVGTAPAAAETRGGSGAS